MTFKHMNLLESIDSVNLLTLQRPPPTHSANYTCQSSQDGFHETRETCSMVFTNIFGETATTMESSLQEEKRELTNFHREKAGSFKHTKFKTNQQTPMQRGCLSGMCTSPISQNEQWLQKAVAHLLIQSTQLPRARHHQQELKKFLQQPQVRQEGLTVIAEP